MSKADVLNGIPQADLPETEEPHELGHLQCQSQAKEEPPKTLSAYSGVQFAQELRALDPDAVADEAKRLRKSKRRHE